MQKGHGSYSKRSLSVTCMSTSLLPTGTLNWVGGCRWAPCRALPVLVPSLPSSRDDVIGKVCLTRDTLVTHPKGKISGREPTAHACFPSLGLPCLSPHWSAQSLAFPLLKGPSSRLLQDPCSEKAISTLPRRARVHLLHTHLCALGPVPLGWDLIAPAKGLAASGGI